MTPKITLILGGAYKKIGQKHPKSIKTQKIVINSGARNQATTTFCRITTTFCCFDTEFLNTCENTINLLDLFVLPSVGVIKDMLSCLLMLSCCTNIHYLV